VKKGDNILNKQAIPTGSSHTIGALAQNIGHYSIKILKFAL